jgi:HSP20 family protein
MTLVKFKPSRNLDSFNTFVENFFSKTMNELFDTMVYGSTVPSVNISENGNAYILELAAPGLQKDKFNIDVNNNVLSIQYKSEEKTEEQNQRYFKREFNYSSFKRAFTVPKNANLEAITATYKDGILTIEVPKKEEHKNGNTIKVAIN